MKASGKNLSTGPKHGLKKPKQLKGSTVKPVEPIRVKSPVWDNTTQQFFENLKKDAARTASVDRFGNYYKDPKTKLWWSKDRGLHGGFHYKVYKETAQGFEHQFNVDLCGVKINNQHKGPTGLFIAKKDIKFKS